MWQVKNKIDSDSVNSHLNNHADGDFTDTLISAPAGMFEGYELTTEAECLARPVVAEVED